MRILITSDIFPPEVGGPATVVVAVAHALAERGHAVRVLTYSDVQGDMAYPFSVKRIRVGGPRSRRLLTLAWRMAANLRWADAVFSAGLLVETALANVVFRRAMLARVPGDIVWERATHKGWISVGFEEFQLQRYGRSIELRRALRNWALCQAQTVVVPSRYTQNLVVRRWGVPESQVRVVLNSVSPPDRRPALEVPLPTRWRLATVCRLIPLKQVDRIIAALPDLPDTGLLVIGDGPERPRLEVLTDHLNLRERVCFVGNVPQDQVRPLLKACDVFVLYSTTENMPNAVLDALAAGTPVVATAVGGTVEIIRHAQNGWLVSPHDETELANAMRTILNDPALGARLVKAGYESLNGFSRARMLREIVQLIEKARLC